MPEGMKPSEIGVLSCFWSKQLPDLQLTMDVSLPHRVYVLGCGQFTYVGFEHKSKVGTRIRDHFAGRGAHYTQEHKPKEVLGVWTVQHAAAEGYVFALLLSTMGAGCVHRLGGYTQTSVTPSPLCKQQYEEQRRLLRNLCFRCGGNHWAKNCQKPVQGIEYKCPSCKESLLISSRGQSVVSGDGERPRGVVSTMPANMTRAAPPPPQVQPAMAPDRPEVRVGKRVRVEATAAPAPRKMAKMSEHVGKTVSICGKRYAAISWYCGKANPSPKLCDRIRGQCSDTAVELRHGDLRSLVQHGYVGTRPKELLPGRQRLSQEWITTDVQCDKHRFLEVRRAGGTLKSNRQVLFLLADILKSEAAR